MLFVMEISILVDMSQYLTFLWLSWTILDPVGLRFPKGSFTASRSTLPILLLLETMELFHKNAFQYDAYCLIQ